MGPQDGGRDPIGVDGAVARLLPAPRRIEREERRLPGPPSRHIGALGGRIAVHEAGPGEVAGVVPFASEAIARTTSPSRAEIEFARERHIAVLGPCIALREVAVSLEEAEPSLLPTKPTERSLKGRDAAMASVTPRPSAKGRRQPLIVSTKAVLCRPALTRCGRKQREHPVPAGILVMHRETDPLQDDVAERVGHDAFLDRVAPVVAAIGEPVARYARGHMLDRARGVALLLREIARTVRDHEAAVPRAA